MNEYGIAAYKALDDIAQKEIAYILEIGGIEIKSNVQLGGDFTLDQLRNEFDVVFIGPASTRLKFQVKRLTA